MRDMLERTGKRNTAVVSAAGLPRISITLAVCILTVAGTFFFNVYQAGQFQSVLVSRIRETAPDSEVFCRRDTVIVLRAARTFSCNRVVLSTPASRPSRTTDMLDAIRTVPATDRHVVIAPDSREIQPRS